MVRIDCLIFGYRRLKIDPENLSTVTSILLRASVASRIDANGEIVVGEKDFLKIKEILQGRVDFTYSEALGAYGWFKKLPYKAAVISALVISVFLTSFLSMLVWDIRVEGNALIDEGEILDGLSECGLDIGDFWCAANSSEIETAFLQKNEKIAWINLNRRGTVFYVSLMEKEQGKIEEIQEMQYCNILAERDCVIEEITVKSGTAVVSVGDTVKKGDVLIQGFSLSELGGKLCAAEGSVLGRVSDSITVDLASNYEEKTVTRGKIYSIDLNFFKISLNILKLYGNFTNECDIIDDEIEYNLLGRCRLPFSITLKYIPKIEVYEKKYTDEEIVSITMEKLNDKTIKLLEGADLLKIRTFGEFTDNGYTAGADIVYLCEVGRRVQFFVD